MFELDAAIELLRDDQRRGRPAQTSGEQGRRRDGQVADGAHATVLQLGPQERKGLARRLRFSNALSQPLAPEGFGSGKATASPSSNLEPMHVERPVIPSRRRVARPPTGR
jgi:hypothetical protein